MNFIQQVNGLALPKIPDEYRLAFFGKAEWGKAGIICQFKNTINAIYGVYNEIPFAMSPRYDEHAKAFEKGFCFINGNWQKMNLEVLRFAKDCASKGEIRFEHWRMPKANKSPEELKNAKAMRKMQSNADATYRYRKGQPVQRKLPNMSIEYESAGQTCYGKRLEMNGKSIYMGKAMIQYMDGNGSGLRPLDTGCFIGTGRKIQFAKAGTF